MEEDIGKMDFIRTSRTKDKNRKTFESKKLIPIQHHCHHRSFTTHSKGMSWVCGDLCVNQVSNGKKSLWQVAPPPHPLPLRTFTMLCILLFCKIF